jgi:hypothetical protein
MADPPSGRRDTRAACQLRAHTAQNLAAVLHNIGASFHAGRTPAAFVALLTKRERGAAITPRGARLGSALGSPRILGEQPPMSGGRAPYTPEGSMPIAPPTDELARLRAAMAAQQIRLARLERRRRFPRRFLPLAAPAVAFAACPNGAKMASGAAPTSISARRGRRR